MNMAAATLAVLEGCVGLRSASSMSASCLAHLPYAIDQTLAGEIQDATFFDLPVWPTRWLLPIPAGDHGARLPAPGHPRPAVRPDLARRPVRAARKTDMIVEEA